MSAPAEKRTAQDDWPLDTWLKLAVRNFGLSPESFWAMSVRDWLVLSGTDNTQAVGRPDLHKLMKIYPDEVTHD